jgi:iron complex transport system substrate-binding protein
VRFLFALIFLSGIGIKDDRGKEFSPILEPERVVSLAPSVTEMLVVLGLKDVIVGATYWDSALVPDAEVVLSSEGTLNLEKLISLNPQVVITAPIVSEDEIERIENLGIKLFYIESRDLLQIIDDLKKLAFLFGKEKLGERIEDSLLLELKRLEGKVKGRPRRVMIILDTYGGFWTAGNGTFLDDLIKRAGGINVFSDVEGWRMVSREAMLKKDPEVIILGWSADPSALKESIFENLSAVKENRIYKVPDPDLLARPSLRSLDALRWLVEILGEDGG